LTLDNSFSSNDWRTSDKQREMINDKLDKMSKKEAGLLIRLIQAIFDDRPSNRN